MTEFVELRASAALAAFFGAGALVAWGGAYYIPAPWWARAALGLWMAAIFGRAAARDARCGLWIPWARARWGGRIPRAVGFEGETAVVVRFADGGETRTRMRGGFCAPPFSVLRIARARGARRIYLGIDDGAGGDDRRRFRAASKRAFARAPGA